jgi:hypothetical protein
MPAIIMDGSWNVIGANQAAQKMMMFLPFNGTANVVACLLNDSAENPVFLNWAELASWTLTRLQIELGRNGGQGPLKALYESLAADPRLIDYKGPVSMGAVLTTRLQAGASELNLFTMLVEFSAAQDINMSERRVELFFAADDVTKDYFEKLTV